MIKEYKQYHSGFKHAKQGFVIALILLFLCFRSCVSYATNRYFAIGGSDLTGTGAIGFPYASLGKANSVAVPGDTLMAGAGVFIFAASQVNIGVGIHIKGIDSTATKFVLTYTYPGGGFNVFNNAAIQFVSTTQNTPGNQTISNIWFDGNNFNCLAGLLVKARGNVIVQNCKFTNFGVTGLNLNGKTGQGTGTPPATFSSGNKVLNCAFYDCSDRITNGANSVSCGSISYAGQKNLIIQYCIFSNTLKPQGHNGNCLTAVQGNNIGFNLQYNSFRKPVDEGSQYNFCLESWYGGFGSIIAHNTFTGGGDFLDHGYGDLQRGDSLYSYLIEENTFSNPSLLTSNPLWPTNSIAIQFEPSTNIPLRPINSTIGDAIIRNNHGRNIGMVLQITLNNYAQDFVKHLTINNNDFSNIGYTNSTYSAALNFVLSNGLILDSIDIYNNSFTSAAGPGSLKAILILQPNVGTMSHINWINNIAVGSQGYGYILFRGSAPTNFVSLKNGIPYGNAFTNNHYILPNTVGAGNFVVGRSYTIVNTGGGSTNFTAIGAANNNAGTVFTAIGAGTGTGSATAVITPLNFTNTNNLKLDPRFVSPSDLHLAAGSPGIGTGLNPPNTYIGAFPVTPSNLSPIADAGTNKNITLPTTSVTQAGSGSDPDGTIAAYNWTFVSGPATATFGSATSATTTINGMSVAGVYVAQLQVTDNLGATAIDTMSIVVNASAPANLPPVVNAGGNKNITLPVSTVTQTGSATDPDGSVVGFAWTQDVGNPIPATIVSPTNGSTVISGMTVGGTYTFTLRATDNLGAVGSQTISVIVNPPTPVAPVAHAGTDQSITWPANSVTLSGSGTDADGGIVGYNWQKTSGGAAAITAASSASTTVTGLSVGVYQFQLTVIDNSGLMATDVVQITVNRGSATIQLINLRKRYTGGLLSPDVTTVPADLAYNLTLDGTSGGKINANDYAAVAGGNDPNWNFTPVTGTFTIYPDSTAAIIAANKTVFYDGNRQNITGSTTPAGIPLAYLYDGADEPGGVTGPGVFDVFIFTASDNYWAPPIHRTLTINVNPAIISISDTDKVYDGSPQTVTVTSDYTFTTVYNPATHINAGSYQVISTIDDGINVGADTATMTIHPKPAVLSWTQPAAQPFGSILNTSILNASADVAGSWSYDHAIGEQLPLGTTRVTGTFTPSSSNYSGGTISVNINVFAVSPFTNPFYIIGPNGVIYIEQ